jgi:hypothetical protein
MYAQSRMRIEVAVHPQNKLCLTIHSDGSPGGPTTTLKPAKHHIFFLESCNHPELPFVQFVKSPGSDQFDYLWNGRQLWRRT